MKTARWIGGEVRQPKHKSMSEKTLEWIIEDLTSAKASGGLGTLFSLLPCSHGLEQKRRFDTRRYLSPCAVLNVGPVLKKPPCILRELRTNGRTVEIVEDYAVMLSPVEAFPDFSPESSFDLNSRESS